MHHTTTHIALFGTALFLPLVGFAQDLGYVEGIFSEVGDVLDTAVPVLVALAVALFIWGLVVFITQTDTDDGREKGRQKMIWGVLALFVIVSIWGLVQILQAIAGVDEDIGIIEAPELPS